MYKFDIWGCTNIGLRRINNEDNFFIDGFYIPISSEKEQMHSRISTKRKHLLAVFDGMGGEACGEVAALISAKTFDRYYQRYYNSNSIDRDIDLFQQYITQANSLVYSQGRGSSQKMMGSTFCCLAIKNGKAIALNLGDSRAYLFRNHMLNQLSTDHTEAERMVRLGIISREQAKESSARNKLNRHLGIPPDEGILEPAISDVVNINENDIFLLCSDGLTDMVSNAAIEKILLSESNSQATCERLLGQALGNGGKDNITIIVTRIVRKRLFRRP